MKLTKAELKSARQVEEKLAQPSLSHDDIDWIYQNYHEGQQGDVSAGAAHFTPYDLAFDTALFAYTVGDIVDIAAGHGLLTYAAICRDYHEGHIRSVTCVEFNPVYHELSKRLLEPMSAYTRSNEPIKVNCVLGNMFDQSLWTSVTSGLTDGKFTHALSNPPFGAMSQADKALASQWMNYTGKRDIAAIELAHRVSHGATFILPPGSVDFRYSGAPRGFERIPCRELDRLRKANPEMFMAMEADGIDGSCYRDQWRSTSITVEVASICFDRQQYS